MHNEYSTFIPELYVNGKKTLSFAFEAGSSLLLKLSVSRKLGLFMPRAEIYDDKSGKTTQCKVTWTALENGFDIYSVEPQISRTGLYFFKLIASSESGERFFEVQLTAYEKGYVTPDWLKGGIMPKSILLQRELENIFLI